MKRRVSSAVIAALMIVPAAVGGQELDDPTLPELSMEQMVVTASGWETRADETAPAITVITAEEIERRQHSTVADVLRGVPGVDVVANGSRGGTTSVFLRGANADQVLVLIDGIKMNSTTTGAFNISKLTTENIERIEVLRGSGGTLYGSEAIGGVIQIFTRQGEGPPRGSVSVAGGNGYTDREVAEVSGRSGILSYSGSVSHFRTEGFQPENDDYENTVVSTRLGADVLPTGRASLTVRAGQSEFGNFFSNNFLSAPDPNARIDEEVLATRGEWSHQAAPGFRYRFGFSYSRNDLDFDDLPDAAETSTLTSNFLTEIISIDGQANISWFGSRVQSIIGVDWDSRSGDVESLFDDPEFGAFPTAFDESVDNVAGYTLQQIYFLDRKLVLSGGVRIDDNDRFGTEVSPSGGLSWQLASATRLRVTYAEGFKAPSLNELFFPGFGNPDLGAETSWEVTAGVDQTLADGRLTFSTNIFHREVDNLIQSVRDPDSGFLLAGNVGKVEIDGLEASLSARICEGMLAGGSYTFLNIMGEQSAKVRRPKHSGSIFVTAEHHDLIRVGDRIVADLNLLLVGNRSDFDPAQFSVIEDNPAYQRLDLTLSWEFPVVLQPVKRIALFARFQNLLDLDYDEVLGFEALPVNVLAGIRAEM